MCRALGREEPSRGRRGRGLARAPESPSPASPCSSIVNVPGESTLRRDFLRLQQENKERSEALRRQQLLQEQQLREQEEYKRQLLAERQKRIEQQKEQRRRLEEVAEDSVRVGSCCLVAGASLAWPLWASRVLLSSRRGVPGLAALGESGPAV